MDSNAIDCLAIQVVAAAMRLSTKSQNTLMLGESSLLVGVERVTGVVELHMFFLITPFYGFGKLSNVYFLDAWRRFSLRAFSVNITARILRRLSEQCLSFQRAFMYSR